MQLDYSTITTQFDTNPRQQIADIRDVYAAIQHPAIYHSKDSIPLWRFVTLNGKPGRRDDVYSAVTAICIEYDDGVVTLESFIEAHQDDVFMWYTTWSHTEEVPRFRVILPLKSPITWADYKLIKADLLALFPSCDMSAFSNWQKVPCARAGYRYGLNTLSAKLLDLSSMVQLAKMRAAADAGVSLSRQAQREATLRRMGADGTWTRERRTRYCKDKLYPKLKELLDQIPLRSGRHQALMNFITYMAALTWPGTQIYIYSSRDAEIWLRPWFCINDKAVEQKINLMIHRFFGNRK